MLTLPKLYIIYEDYVVAGAHKTIHNITGMWSAGVLMNTSRFVLWFCVSDVSNIIICEKLRDENFWFWLVLLIGCLMVAWSSWRR